MLLPARGGAALALQDDLACSYYPLPLCLPCRSAQQFPSTASLHNAASEAMPLFRTQSAAKQSSLAPHDSKARLRDVTTRRRSMAKPCTPHPIAQRLQLFKPQTGNVGGRGVLPSRSLGGSRGPFSHVREWPPYCALPHAAGEPKTQPLRAAPPSAPAGCPKPRSRAYVASAEPRSALKSGRNALHSHPSSQRRRTPSPSFTSKVKTTASSVCALTR